VSEQEQYDELAYYTLAHPDPGFIHQNIVDAFAAQTASEADKPIKIAFALVGLYLCVVKGRRPPGSVGAHAFGKISERLAAFCTACGSRRHPRGRRDRRGTRRGKGRHDPPVVRVGMGDVEPRSCADRRSVQRGARNHPIGLRYNRGRA
jgi:hypothetical protein